MKLNGSAKRNHRGPKIHCVLFALVFVGLIVGADGLIFGEDAAQSQDPSWARVAYPAETKSLANTNLTTLIMRDEDFWTIQDEPVNHLGRASEALNLRDPKSAARELRVAAFFAKTHAANVQGDAKSELLASAAGLESLASRLNKGLPVSRRELAIVEGRTYLSLARYHYVKAMEAQAKHDTRTAERHLTAAADYLENHFQSTGVAIDQTTQTLLADLRKAGKSAEASAGRAEAETGRLLESLGKKIQELGHKLESGQPKDAGKPQSGHQ